MKPKKKAVKKTRLIDSTAAFEKLLKNAGKQQHYQLRLYITGTSPRSTRAIANIRALCEEHLAGNYDLKVIDIYQQPTEASSNQIIAAPTLLKELPFPARRLIGDLSDRSKVMIGLDLKDVSGTAKKGAKKTQWLEA